jgi:hypothetical protein
MTTHIFHRGLHATASALALLAATIIAFWVIPDVRTDPLASPQAVPAFWINVISNTLVGIGILAGTFPGRFSGAVAIAHAYWSLPVSGHGRHLLL